MKAACREEEVDKGGYPILLSLVGVDNGLIMSPYIRVWCQIEGYSGGAAIPCSDWHLGMDLQVKLSMSTSL